MTINMIILTNLISIFNCNYGKVCLSLSNLITMLYEKGLIVDVVVCA